MSMQSPTRTRSLLVLPFAVALAIASVGCSSGDNPLAPASPTPDPEEEVSTPVSLRITSISVTRYGSKDGDDWDWSYGSKPERPDVYVTLHLGSSEVAPIYVSDVVEDAFSGVDNRFTRSSAGVGLPKTVPANRSMTIVMMDDDGALGDDFMGQVSFSPLSAHDGSRTTTFWRSYSGSNGSRFEVRGEWVY